MPAWKGIVGLSFSPEDFDTYCRGLHWTAWRPSFVVLHNTAPPTLNQRPNGFSKQNILDLEAFYRDERKWSAGPHLFIDDKQIWAFTPMTTTGVHSPSFNAIALGFEMLGDYDTDDFTHGRGLAVQKNAVAAVASVSAALGLDPDSMKLHKEDPKTDHKNCPGKTVDKAKFIQAVKDLIASRHDGEHAVAEADA